MRVFLIGYMGSGKSTLGRQLAEKLNCPFIDLDDWIEEHSGLTISQWFSEMGEDEFRLQEGHQLLQILPLYEHVIVATGGGTPCFQDNFSVMQEHGLTVYLRWPEQQLFENLKDATAHRPLLAGKSEASIRGFIHDHLQQREPTYLLSEYVLEMETTSADDVVQLIRDHDK